MDNTEPEAVDFGLPIVATATRPHPLVRDAPGTQVTGMVVGLKTYKFVRQETVQVEQSLVRVTPEEYSALFAGAVGLRQINVDLTASGRREIRRADKAWDKKQ